MHQQKKLPEDVWANQFDPKEPMGVVDEMRYDKKTKNENNMPSSGCI